MKFGVKYQCGWQTFTEEWEETSEQSVIDRIEDGDCYLISIEKI